MTLKGRLSATAAGLMFMAAASLALTGAAAASSPVVRAYSGQINGAGYRVEVPDPWNGDLVMWSHSAYYYGFTGPSTIELTNQEPTENGW